MLVEERRWLSDEEFSEALSLCQVLPGPNIVNMAVCVGTRFAGPWSDGRLRGPVVRAVRD